MRTVHQSVLAKVGIVPGSIVAAVALACSASAGAATNTPNLSASANLDLRTGPFYEDASPFNTPVPANPQPVWNSWQIVQRVTSWGPPARPYAGAAGTSDDWSHPLVFRQAFGPGLHDPPDRLGQRRHRGPTDPYPGRGAARGRSRFGDQHRPALPRLGVRLLGCQDTEWQWRHLHGEFRQTRTLVGKRSRDEQLSVSRRNHRRRVLGSGGRDHGVGDGVGRDQPRAVHDRAVPLRQRLAR